MAFPARRWQPALIVLHRWLGIGLSLMMLAWFASGVVMVFHGSYAVPRFFWANTSISDGVFELPLSVIQRLSRVMATLPGAMSPGRIALILPLTMLLNSDTVAALNVMLPLMQSVIA